MTSCHFEGVIFRAEDGLVTVYGETWPTGTEKRVAAAIRDALAVVNLPTRPRVVKTPAGDMIVVKFEGLVSKQPEVRLMLLSGSPIYGSESWAKELASKLETV